MVVVKGFCPCNFPSVVTNQAWEDNIKMDFQEVGCRTWTGSSWLRIGAGSGHCECGNEHLGSTKCGEFLD